MDWLLQAARHGLTFAKALCARLNDEPVIQISFQEELEWLRGAAKIGSRIALLQLKERDEKIYQLCLESYQKDFWAGVYAVPDVWQANLKECGNNPDNLRSLLAIHPREVTLGSHNSSLLHCAAMVGSVEGVKLLISEHGLSINSTNDRSETPLFLACRSGHGDVVQYLLSMGANAGICNVVHENGLHWVDSFDVESVQDIVASLVAHGAMIDQLAEPDDTFFPFKTRMYYSQWYPGTPLQRAVVGGNLVAICALLEWGASLSVEYKGINAIDRAAQLRQGDILSLLLAHDPSFNLSEERTVASGRRLSPIHRAIESVDKLQLLFVHGKNYAQALQHTMSIIFAHGIDLSNMTINLLHYAAEKNNSEALKMMLEYQALDVNERENKGDLWTPTPLLKAIQREDEDSVEILLQHGADANAHRRWRACFLSPLMSCLIYWHKSTIIAERLISFGAEVNHNPDPTISDTTLYWALTNNDFHIADLLLRHGASLSFRSAEATLNFMGALVQTKPTRLLNNALSYLVGHSLKPEIPFITSPTKQSTVFHTMCSLSEVRRNCLPPADFLANLALLRRIFPDPHLINIPDGNDLLPLHYAAWYAFPEAVRALLEAGADPFYSCGPRTSGKEDTPPIPRGRSVLEMVQEDEFCPLVGFAKVNPEVAAEWNQRREEVRALIEPYM